MTGRPDELRKPMTAVQGTKAMKRIRIVEAAARVFARQGFFGTAVADVALEAGIGKGTIYDYFDSKEALFFAVFEWFSEKTTHATRVEFSALSGSASERLEALVESLIKSGVEMKDFYSLSMEFWAASASSRLRKRFRDAFRQIYGGFRGIVSALIRDGIQRGEFCDDTDPESIAAALVGTLDALALQAWFEYDFDPLKTAKDFMVVLIRGLSAQNQISVNNSET